MSHVKVRTVSNDRTESETISCRPADDDVVHLPRLPSLVSPGHSLTSSPPLREVLPPEWITDKVRVDPLPLLLSLPSKTGVHRSYYLWPLTHRRILTDQPDVSGNKGGDLSVRRIPLLRRLSSVVVVTVGLRRRRGSRRNNLGFPCLLPNPSYLLR